MTFDAYETADGSPLELLTFSNGGLIFRYANTVRSYFNGANEHFPLAYERTQWSQSKDSDDSNITVTLAGNATVTSLYDGPLNSGTTLLTIERFHEDDPANQITVHWKGEIISSDRVENDMKFLLAPLSQGTEQTPSDVFSGLCNRHLFESPGCNLDRNDFRFIATVSAIDADGLGITFTGLRAQAAAIDATQGGPTGPLSSGELDIYWQGGYIQLANGEIRDIVEGNYQATPDKVRIVSKFRDITVGDGGNVYAGCDLTIATCHKKFNNAINHQGFPNIPEIDPANTELPPGSRTSGSGFTG